MRPPKMYIITRQDLAPGYQAVQSAHAALDFAVRYPQITAAWNEQSNYLALLSVPDEPSLWEFSSRVAASGLPMVEFFEPDIGNAMTAIAIAPSEETERLCKGLPLALKEVRK